MAACSSDNNYIQDSNDGLAEEDEGGPGSGEGREQEDGDFGH